MGFLHLLSKELTLAASHGLYGCVSSCFSLFLIELGLTSVQLFIKSVLGLGVGVPGDSLGYKPNILDWFLCC